MCNYHPKAAIDLASCTICSFSIPSQSVFVVISSRLGEIRDGVIELIIHV